MTNIIGNTQMPVIVRSSMKAQQKAQKYAGRIWRRAIEKGVSARTTKSVKEYIKKGKLAPAEVDQIFGGAVSLTPSSMITSSCPVIERSNAKSQKKAQKYAGRIWYRAIKEGVTNKVRENAEKIIRRGKLSRAEVDQVLARFTSRRDHTALIPPVAPAPVQTIALSCERDLEQLSQIFREQGIRAASRYWEGMITRWNFMQLRESLSVLPPEMRTAVSEAVRQIIFAQAENFAEIPTIEGQLVCDNFLNHFSGELPEGVYRLKMGILDQVLSMCLRSNGISVEVCGCGSAALALLMNSRAGGLDRMVNRTLTPDDRELLQRVQRSHRVHMRRMGIQTPLDRLPEGTEVRRAIMMRDHFTRVGSFEVTHVPGVNITGLCGIMDAAVRAGEVPDSFHNEEDGNISRDEIRLRVGLLLGGYQLRAQLGDEGRGYIRDVLQHYTLKLQARINAAGGNQTALREIYTEVKQTLFEELGFASFHCIDRQTQVARQIWRMFCVNTENSSIENQVITWFADRREAIADGVILDYLDERGGIDRSSLLAAYKYAFRIEFGLSGVQPQGFFNVNPLAIPEIRARFHATYNHETILRMVREAYQGPSEGTHPAFKYQNIEAFLTSRISNILDFRPSFFDEDEEGIPLDYPKDELVALYLQEMGILNLGGQLSLALGTASSVEFLRETGVVRSQ